MATKIKQGEHYWEDYSCPTVSTLDTNWVGTWGIVTALGTVPVVTGTMLKSTDSSKFYLRVLPEHTAALAVGDYILIVQIANATLGYNKEEQIPITIKKQGLA